MKCYALHIEAVLRRPVESGKSRPIGMVLCGGIGLVGRQRLDLMAVVPEGQSPPPRRERLLSKDGFNRSTQQPHEIVVLVFRSPASYRRLEKDLDPIRSYVFPGRNDIEANPCSHVQERSGVNTNPTVADNGQGSQAL